VTPPLEQKGSNNKGGKGKKGKGKGKEKRRDGPYESALMPTPPHHPPAVAAPTNDDVLVSRTNRRETQSFRNPVNSGPPLTRVFLPAVSRHNVIAAE
jgi:hypothetical protein